MSAFRQLFLVTGGFPGAIEVFTDRDRPSQIVIKLEAIAANDTDQRAKCRPRFSLQATFAWFKIEMFKENEPERITSTYFELGAAMLPGNSYVAMIYLCASRWKTKLLVTPLVDFDHSKVVRFLRHRDPQIA